VKFGLYRLHEPSTETELASIEKKYRTPISIVSVYRAWNKCSVQDDLNWLEQLKKIPRDILLTWEPWKIPPSPDRPFDQPDFALKHIITGRYDEYIRSFSRELATFSQTIFLRTMHEMNGNWYPWCGTVNGNSAELHIAAWNHIRNLVNREVPTGIKWVWSPYAHSYPDQPSNSIDSYFPGDDSLDMIAIDGYNWGDSQEWSEWQSFEDIFSDSYESLSALSQRPFMIGETGCDESGGNKERWIAEAFNILKTRFNKIDALIWFDEKKECDWKISSSAASLQAFRAIQNI